MLVSCAPMPSHHRLARLLPLCLAVSAAYAADAPASFVTSAETRPAAFEMSWTPLRLPNGDRSALFGGSYLVAVNEDWGFGPSVYGAARGNYGGVFAAGLTAQRRWRLSGDSHLALGLYAGAGGGLSSEQIRYGGGLMLRPELSLRTQVGNWYSGLALSHVRFPSGNVKSSSIALVLGRSDSFASFAPSDAGRLGRSSGRSGMGFDEIALSAGVYLPRKGAKTRSGQPSARRMYTAGADLRQYLAPGSWWGLEASGAAKGGADGYMEILGTAGQDWALGTPNLRAGLHVAAGLGGGGNVATGNGWLLRAGPSLRWLAPWGGSVRLEGGWLRSASGGFSAPYGRLSLALPLERRARDDSFWQLEEGVVRTQTFYAAVQQLPSMSYKNGSSASIGQIGLLMTRELKPWLYGAAQAGSAAFGKAGAYSYGLFGLGLQTPLWANQWRAGAELLVGAAGGGGVAVGGGAVMQMEAWGQWEGRGDWDRLRLRAGLGQWRTMKAGTQSSAVYSLAVGYAFGTMAP